VTCFFKHYKNINECIVYMYLGISFSTNIPPLKRFPLAGGLYSSCWRHQPRRLVRPNPIGICCPRKKPQRGEIFVEIYISSQSTSLEVTCFFKHYKNINECIVYMYLGISFSTNIPPLKRFNQHLVNYIVI